MKVFTYEIEHIFQDILYKKIFTLLDKKLWAVFDYPVVEGKPPPSCMLAHFNANFNLHHGLFGKEENETNFLNLLKNADITNHTCHTGWEEKKQKLILTPTNYSEHIFKFSFHFKQTEDEDGVGFLLLKE